MKIHISLCIDKESGSASAYCSGVAPNLSFDYYKINTLKLVSTPLTQSLLSESEPAISTGFLTLDSE
jgi:hypothetical protein